MNQGLINHLSHNDSDLSRKLAQRDYWKQTEIFMWENMMACKQCVYTRASCVAEYDGL
jgi:hypothetical protein